MSIRLASAYACSKWSDASAWWGVAALTEVHGAEVVQRAADARVVADLPEDDQRPLMVLDGFVLTAHDLVDDAQVSQRGGLAGEIVVLAEDDERFLVLVDGVVEATQQIEEVAQVVEHGADLAVVADLAIDRQCPLEVVERLGVAAPAPVDAADVVQGRGLARPVGLSASGPQRVAVDGERIDMVRARVEVAPHNGGQPAGMSWPAMVGRERRRRHHVGPFGVQPGPCRRRLGEVRSGQIHLRRDMGAAMPLVWEERVHGGRRDDQVMIEEAGQGRVPVGGGVLVGGAFRRVLAQQVVHADAAGPGRQDQVRALQLFHDPRDLIVVAADERRRGVAVDVLARMQAQQPERAGRLGRQVPVRPREHGADRGSLVGARVQQVQAPVFGQLGGELGQAYGRARDRQLGRDAQCQRQPHATLGQRDRRVGLDGDPVTDQGVQEVHRLRPRHEVKVDTTGTVASHQTRHAVATGHHRQAGRGTGQQRAHLVRRVRVVEHQQDPPPEQQRPVPRDPPVDVVRELAAADA